MDLGTNDGFAGDIDILACLRRWPNGGSPWPGNQSPWHSDTPKKGSFYRTWEVKVAKLHENGGARSLKRGKNRKILSQLDAQRRFGSPNASLLDVYLCEAGFRGKGKAVIPPDALESIRSRFPELQSNRYGYQVLAFGHGKSNDDDIGLFTVRFTPNMSTALDLLYPAVSRPGQPFSALASRIDSVWESTKTRGPFQQMIVFCRVCRSLKVICTQADEYKCPDCHDDLIAQS